MAQIQAWLTSAWRDVGTQTGLDHKQATLLLAVTGAALLFRWLSHATERICRQRYKTKHDAAIAVYRIVGLIHHAIQVPIAMAVLMDKNMWADRLFSSSNLSTTMVVISCGYFCHDFIHCIENIAVQGVSYVIHGAGCATVYLFALLQNPTMLHFYGAGFLMWEISSFFVHARWFLFKMPGASKQLQLLNGLCLLLSFFFARIVWGLYLSWMYWKDISTYNKASQTFVYTTMAANVALNILNCYWFALILGKAVEALSGKKDSLGKRD